MTMNVSSFLGVLMLDTAFPRIMGDAGNINSYDCPARLKIVKDAGSLEIVQNGRPADELIEKFCKAAQELEAEGASAIVSTCGFLMTIQEQIANAVSIPVMVSSLSLHPIIRAVMGEGKIGILTASKNALGTTVLDAAKINPNDVAIKGLEDCLAFSTAILTEKKNQPSEMDIDVIEKAVLKKSLELMSENPTLTAILLECGNLPPYAAAIEENTGLPVFSILDGAKLIWRKKMSDYIPIVDVSTFKNGSLAQKKKVAKEIRETAENSGFFYISGHGIPQALVKQAFATSQRFFALDQKQKSEITVDKNQRGWMAEGLATLEGSKTHDAKEIFFWGWDVDENDPDTTLPMVAPNLWPQKHAPWLKQDLSPYYQAACDVGGIVMSALALSFDLKEDFFEDAYRKPLARGQLVYYPPFTEKDEASERFSAAPHTDFGVLTLLLQDNNGGLQVRSKDGNWIDAPPVEGTLICNIGDLLQRWSNKRLVSTVHRVINRSGNERYSIPIFFDPHSATEIDPCDLGVSKDASLYETTTAGDYIAAKNTKNFSHYSKE